MMMYGFCDQFLAGTGLTPYEHCGLSVSNPAYLLEYFLHFMAIPYNIEKTIFLLELFLENTLLIQPFFPLAVDQIPRMKRMLELGCNEHEELEQSVKISLRIIVEINSKNTIHADSGPDRHPYKCHLSPLSVCRLLYVFLIFRLCADSGYHDRFSRFHNTAQSSSSGDTFFEGIRDRVCTGEDKRIILVCAEIDESAAYFRGKSLQSHSGDIREFHFPEMNRGKPGQIGNILWLQGFQQEHGHLQKIQF